MTKTSPETKKWVNLSTRQGDGDAVHPPQSLDLLVTPSLHLFSWVGQATGYPSRYYPRIMNIQTNFGETEQILPHPIPRFLGTETSGFVTTASFCKRLAQFPAVIHLWKNSRPESRDE